jgi:hypothetical protein
VGAGVEEGEPGVVDRPGGIGEHGREQRSPEGIGGDGVEAAVVDDGRHLGHPVEDAQEAGPELLSR